MKQGCFTGLLFALLAQAGCGSKGGSSSAIIECTQGAIASEAALAGPALHPESMNAKYSRLIVQTRGDSTALIQALRPSGEAVRGHRVVKFQADIERLSDHWQVVAIKAGDRSALLETLMKTPGVVSVEPDFVVETQHLVEEAATEQWAHRKVESESAWRITRGSDAIVVAVIDGGVDIGHPDLAENVFRNTRESVNGRDDDGNGYVDDTNGWDYVNGDSNPRSDSASHFHGSHVAGIVGAVTNRSSRLIGHAPDVRILPLKFIGSDGKGNTSHAIRAIDYAITMGAHIINASWSSTNYSSALLAAIRRAQSAGILFVAAAGNDGQSNDSVAHYPANYGLSNIVAVGASNSSDQLAGYSNYGLGAVDIAAPGSSIYSLKNGSAYATMSGTSMATPLVTGIAVLVKAHHPSFKYAKLAQSLFMGVDKFASMKPKLKYGGRINARKAIEASDAVFLGTGVPLGSAEPLECN